MLILRHNYRCNRTGGSSHKRAAGFSLIELILILVIVSAMTLLVGVGTYQNSSMHQRLLCAARSVQANLHLARQRAIVGSQTRTVRFDVMRNAYMLYGISDPDLPERPDTFIEFEETPYDVTLKSVDINGGIDVVYDPYGRPEAGGTLVLELGPYTTTITVDPDTGLVTID